MKKRRLLFLLPLAALLIPGCTPKENGGNGGQTQPSGGGDSGSQDSDTTAPVISGVQMSLSCEAGQTFNLLEGITAQDNVDGDITNRIVVAAFPDLAINNGVISPTAEDTGFYDISYTVSDNAGNETTEYSELNITKALAPKTLYKEYNFGDDLQGWEPYVNEGVVGTHGVSQGKYVFDITQSTGTDWHIKYAYYNYPVEAGHEYTVRAKLNSSVAGTMKFNGADKSLHVGNNNVSAIFSANVDGARNIEMQFGLLTGPFQVKLEEIIIEDSYTAIDETQTEEMEILTTGLLTEGWTFNKDNWHSEYSAGNGVTANVQKTADYILVSQTKAGPGWAGKLLVQTKHEIVANTKYTVSLTLEASSAVSGLEYGYGGWDDDFKKFHATYGYGLQANTPTLVTFDVTPDANFDNPMFCLKMGAVPAGVSIKASAFSVTYDTGAAAIDFTNEDFAKAWSETTNRNEVTGRTETAITTTLHGNAEDPYKASTNLDIKGVNMIPSKSYRVTFKLASSVDLDKVSVMMGAPAWDPNSLFESGETISLEAGKARKITALLVNPASTKDVQIRVKYGNAPDGATFTVSDLKFETIKFIEATAENILPNTWTFDGNGNVQAKGDHTPTVTKTATSAVFTSTAGGDCWQAKAIVNTRTTLEVGNRYHLALDVEVSADVTKFEVGAGFEDGDFKQIDHKYEMKFTAGVKQTVEFTVEPATNQANWGFGVFMGTAAAGVTVTLSNLVVEIVPAAVNKTEKSFVFTPQGIGHYANVDEGAASELYVEDGVLIYNITALSHESDWYNKFFLSDIYLEGGSMYIFELVVKSDTPLNGDLLLNKSGAWDVRAQQAFELTTEYQTITLETPVMTAGLTFELLFQDLHQNQTVDHAKISFQSIKIFARAADN